MEWRKENISQILPKAEINGRTVYTLSDLTETTIGGVTYRVKSVFADNRQIGELLDLAVIEKINRTA